LVNLCDKCAPLLQDPKLDTIGRLRARLCLLCKLELAREGLQRRVAKMGLSEKEKRLIRKYGADRAARLPKR
jgi:hypothetical protein